MIPAAVQTRRGFTFIEVVLYVAIVSLFMVGLITFSWDIIYGREKASVQQSVEQSARIAMQHIAQEIRQAESFTVVSSTELQLTGPGGTSTIAQSGSTLQLDGTNLTSNQVVVDSFSVTDLSTPSSAQVGISLSVLAAASGSQHFEAAITLTQAVELNTQFNQGRSLLVDMSALALASGDTSIQGIVLENTGGSSLTIDQIAISWSGTSGGEQITTVQINGGAPEWTGSQGSGSVLDITDVTLSAAATAPIDAFTFSGSVAGGSFEVRYILSDGSQLPTTFVVQAVGGSPTPTPSVSPSPSPSPNPSPSPSPSPTSCSTYCQGLGGFSGGTCRANTNQCNQNGESYQSGGNTYCTGGGGSDTCCCAN